MKIKSHQKFISNLVIIVFQISVLLSKMNLELVQKRLNIKNKIDLNCFHKFLNFIIKKRQIVLYSILKFKNK